MTDPRPAPEAPDSGATGTAPADWYPDPTGRFDLRYFNGATWTADVAAGGRRLVDPDPAIEPEHSGAIAARRTRLGGVSMTAGIVAVAVGWIPFVVVIGAVAAIVAIACGIVARRRAAGGADPRAGIGIVTGAIGLLACVAGLVLTVAVTDALDRYRHPAPHTVAIDTCSVTGGLATAAVSVTSEDLDGTSADFTVEVLFVRRGTDNVLGTSRLAIDGVPGGATRTAETTRRVSGSGGTTSPDVTCLIGDVNGPYPFGIAIDW